MSNPFKLLIALASLGLMASASAQTISFTRYGSFTLKENEFGFAEAWGFGNFTLGTAPVWVGGLGTGAVAYSTWWSEWADEPYQKRSDYDYHMGKASASYTAQFSAIYGTSVNTLLVKFPAYRYRSANSTANISGDYAVVSEATGNAMHEGAGWPGCKSIVHNSGETDSRNIADHLYETTPIHILFTRVPGTDNWVVSGGKRIRVHSATIKAYARTVVSNDDWYGGQVEGRALAHINDSVAFGPATSSIDPGIVLGTLSVPRLTSALEDRAVTIRLRSTGSSTDLEVMKDALFLEGNQFWIGGAGLTGNHDVIVTRKGCLRKKMSSLGLTPGSVTNASANLILGDVNGDNVINATDASAVSARIGATVADADWFEPGVGGLSAYDCDVDEDGAVDAEDLDIVQDNLSLSGD